MSMMYDFMPEGSFPLVVNTMEKVVYNS